MAKSQQLPHTTHLNANVESANLSLNMKKKILYIAQHYTQTDPNSRSVQKHHPNYAVPTVTSAADTSFDLLKVAFISALISRNKIFH